MHRPVILVDHDPEWKRLAADEACRIGEALGEALVAIHHIGSTSIPGIKAKPIIDLVGVVRDLPSLEARNPSLEKIGYLPRGEAGIAGRRYFTKDTRGARTHHLHCFVVGHSDIDRHLLFRDYLIAHPQAAFEYQRLKEDLARKFPDDSAAYTEAKTPFIRRTDDAAREWAADTCPRLPVGDGGLPLGLDPGS